MNLHAVVSGVISVVNPNQPATLAVSAGYSTSASGVRTPAYAAPVTVTAQVQELTQRDLRQLEGLNLQGAQRSVYLTGALSGTLRVTAQGGDLVTLQDGSVWLTTAVLEQWPDWVKVAVTLQDGG